MLCGRIRRRQIRPSAPGSDKTAHPVLDAPVPPARLSTGDSLSGRTRRSISGRTRSDRRWSVVVVQAHDPLSPLTPSSYIERQPQVCMLQSRRRRGIGHTALSASLRGTGTGCIPASLPGIGPSTATQSIIYGGSDALSCKPQRSESIAWATGASRLGNLTARMRAASVGEHAMLCQHCRSGRAGAHRLVI